MEICEDELVRHTIGVLMRPFVCLMNKLFSSGHRLSPL